jgi:hypothetical protein
MMLTYTTNTVLENMLPKPTAFFHSDVGRIKHWIQHGYTIRFLSNSLAVQLGVMFLPIATFAGLSFESPSNLISYLSMTCASMAFNSVAAKNLPGQPCLVHQCQSLFEVKEFKGASTFRHQMSNSPHLS